MRILGIDPGSAVTGFGVVESEGGRLVHVAHGTLRPPPRASLAERLHHLHDAVRSVVDNHAPDVAVIEKVFVSASPHAALVLGQARGAVLAAIAARGVRVAEYAPAQIKQAATGSGRAAKRQVQYMMRRLLQLDRLPPADAADALAAAVCHAGAARLGGAAPRSRNRRVSLRARRAL